MNNNDLAAASKLESSNDEEKQVGAGCANVTRQGCLSSRDVFNDYPAPVASVQAAKADVPAAAAHIQQRPASSGSQRSTSAGLSGDGGGRAPGGGRHSKRVAQQKRSAKAKSAKSKPKGGKKPKAKSVVMPSQSDGKRGRGRPKGITKERQAKEIESALQFVEEADTVLKGIGAAAKPRTWTIATAHELLTMSVKMQRRMDDELFVQCVTHIASDDEQDG